MFLGFISVNHEPSLTSAIIADHIALVPLNFIAFIIYFIIWAIAYTGGIFLLFLQPLMRVFQDLAFSTLILPANIFLEVSRIFSKLFAITQEPNN